MRRSYNIQPAAASRHKQQAFPDEQRKEARTNFREEKNLYSAASHGRAEKKEAPDQTKKLERKPTEDINASAEAFIKNFRQQLVIQRLQSIENYEQMLARGL